MRIAPGDPTTADHRLTFRWLGVAGIELRLSGHVLLVDPFLTRPPIRRLLLGRLQPDRDLLRTAFPRCDAILVTHAHWDHLLDVPAIAVRTGAIVVGSANTCRIAVALGVPAGRVRQVQVGDRVPLAAFTCEVLSGDHGRTPLDRLINGALPADLYPPLRLRDYRMDVCFGFAIEAGGTRILHLPKLGRPADVLTVTAAMPRLHLARLLREVTPRLVVPLHWDDLFRPVIRPLRPMLAPPAFAWPPFRRLHPERFAEVVEGQAPGTQVLLPELFAMYSMDARALPPRGGLAATPGRHVS